MNPHLVAGKAESYWLATTPETNYPSLRQGIKVDVAIIGGGFVGIMCAFFLKEAGFGVAVIEGRRILQGATGSTTAKVTSLHGLKYSKISREFGMEKARLYADSNQAAIEKLESLIREKNISCDFSRLPFFLFTEDKGAVKHLEEEADVGLRLGLPVSFLQEVPLPFKNAGGIRLENQAQIHPRKFLLSLAAAIPGGGSYIFENSRVNHIEHGQINTLSTVSGTIQANNVIVATNYPVFEKEGFYYARLKQERSYALAVKSGKPFTEGMFFDDKGSGWRTQPDEGGNLLIFSGGGHVAGREKDTTRFYKELESKIKEKGIDASIEYSCSTQDSVSFDNVPFIGKFSPLHNNMFLASGFNQWGMTTSVVAGILLSDLIKGNKNPWSELYNPLRFTPEASSAKELIIEDFKTTKLLVEAHLPKKIKAVETKPGEGNVVDEHGRKTAQYLDDGGITYRLDPACTHMGCIVNWNNAEKTWDCPCHGSRFGYTGEVINAPAVKGLSRLE